MTNSSLIDLIVFFLQKWCTLTGKVKKAIFFFKFISDYENNFCFQVEQGPKHFLITRLVLLGMPLDRTRCCYYKILFKVVSFLWQVAATIFNNSSSLKYNKYNNFRFPLDFPNVYIHSLIRINHKYKKQFSTKEIQVLKPPNE